MKDRVLCAALATVTLAAVPLAFGQIQPSDTPVLSQAGPQVRGQLAQPAGPNDFVNIPLQAASGRMMLESESALLQPIDWPEGGFPNMDLGVGIGQGDDGSRYIDQPYNCNNGYFSNNNSTSNPYMTFEDFVADGSPLSNVKFYGGVYDASTGTNGSLGNLASIGIEIWTTGGGDTCGWVYDSFVGGQTFTLAELSPSFVCDTGGFYNAFEFTANFAGAIPLNAGQNYMITVYGTLADGTSSYLFAWNESTVNNYNPSSSWDRTDGSYGRCGPDVAFATNTGSSNCQDNDCNTTCWFSNLGSNANPYIALDDFTASATNDLRRLQFTGGGWDIGTGTPSSLANISGFYIELYRSIPDGGQPCGNWQDLFYGSFTVDKADANAVFDCIDIFGIPQYQFTVNIPAGTYSLVDGERYLLGVYGIPVDPDDTRIFCWGGTDAIYDFTSWSFNTDTGVQEICHDVDQAFCINPARPCLGDYNGDGIVNTIDFLDFLDDWANQRPKADIDTNGIVNTMDFLAFLNRWAAGC
ncbi:hypothetical protein MNBD_PLANCTO03-1494 [hydrothermal vent metagenome]|uniref:Dockerin domain-containing protein n=1 Tax=hydrothermal vent metagenome TaxID=652676 RepID=A0A3B1E853_9ZZZZ